MLRAGSDLGARLLVEFAVALDEPGLQCVDDHRRRFIKALPGFVHAEPERGKLAPRQSTSKTEPKPALAQHVEHRRLLGDAQWIVPRENDGCGAQVDIA